MKTLLLLAVFSTSIFSAQQLSKKEAYNRFKNSNIRKALGIKLNSFNYNELLEKSKHFDIPLKNMVILNSTTDNDLLNQIEYDFSRRNPKEKDGADFCTYCKFVPFADITNYSESSNELSE